MHQWQYLIIILVLFSLRVESQPIDTFEIEEIQIQTTRLYSLISADTISAGRKVSSSTPLHFTRLQLRENNPGGITTFNTRGTTPQQNTIFWAGMELNNPMLGLADLSLFPAYLFDAVLLHQGGNPNLPFSGKPGGSLELVTSSDPKLADGLSLSLSNLSTENRNSLTYLKSQIALSNTSIGINAAYSDYRNRYKFTHPNGTTKRQSHGRGIHRNSTVNIHHQINNSSDLTLNTWIQNTERQVPPTLFEQSSSASQRDKAIRIAAHYRKQLGRSLLGFRPGFNREVLNYSDPVSGEFSNSTITTRQVSTYWTGQIISQLPLKVEAVWRNRSIQTDAYQVNPSEDDLLLSAGLRIADILPNFSAAAYLRKKYSARSNSPLLARLEFSIVPKYDRKIFISIENHHRNPTLNDLYWPILGNPDLKSERGHAAESGIRLKNGGHGIEYLSGKIFYRRTDRLIYWSNHSGVWKPENLSAVVAYGLDLEAKYDHEFNKLKIGANLNYQFLKTSLIEERFPGDPSEGKQLPYQPEHNILSTVSLSYKSTVLTFNQKWTSTRYVSSDHSQYLSPLLLLSAGIGHFFSIGPTTWEVSLFCDNLFDKEFFSVSRRPMPGRTLGIQLTTNLNNKRCNH
ncbi:MAG: TonB-dependent receptor [Saprospirales bacterium]|nr:MAG: TonB-dependent receptor [Saprospirales bacterium]